VPVPASARIPLRLAARALAVVGSLALVSPLVAHGSTEQGGRVTPTPARGVGDLGTVDIQPCRGSKLERGFTPPELGDPAGGRVTRKIFC